jgi:hypothetical protein
MTVAEVACTNRSVQTGPKPVALVLPRNGQARVAALRIGWGSSTPVLRSGTPRRLGVFTCKTVGTGLLCSVANGGAVGASSKGISVLAPPAAH